MESFISC